MCVYCACRRVIINWVVYKTFSSRGAPLRCGSAVCGQEARLWLSKKWNGVVLGGLRLHCSSRRRMQKLVGGGDRSPQFTQWSVVTIGEREGGLEV